MSIQQITDEGFLDVILDDVADVSLALAKRVFKGVVDKTPVRTGQARYSWHVGIDAPDTRTLDHGTKILQKPRFPGHITRQVLRKERSVSSLHVSNSKHYIVYLENGSPTTRAYGMVATTLAELG